MLAAAAVEQATAHLIALDALLPGRVTGYYLVGSAALGDWEARVSNLDVVVVADEPWSAGELTEAARLHHQLHAGDEPPALAYTTFDTLARGHAGSDASASAATFTGMRPSRPGEGIDTPLTRAVLAEEAVALRGSDWITVADAGPEALQPWAVEQLTGRWRRAIAGVHPPGTYWRRKPLAEHLLEVCRLHVAATTGRAVSKSRAASLVLDDVPPRFSRVVGDAAGFRQGSRTSMYWGPAERKTHSIELMRLLVDLATPG